MLASTTASEPPVLPYDLERTIIEYAAWHDPTTAVKLMRLSQEVKRWIEPILYRHIRLDTAMQTDAFIKTLDARHRKRPDFFPNTVKSLTFNYTVTLHQAAKILSICRCIISLSTHIEFSQKTLEFTFDDVIWLSRFVATLSPIFKHLIISMHNHTLSPDPSFHAPIMRHVTHLSIFGGSEYFQKQWSWTGFNALQYLTHFSFDLYTSLSPEVVYQLIPQFPESLQVCLVLLSAREGEMPLGEYLSHHKEAKQMVVGEMDKRIVIGVAEDVSDHMDLSEWPGLLVARRWDDHFGSYEPLQKAEHVVKTRTTNSWCASKFHSRAYTTHIGI